jgi:hypothetical protein
MDAKPDFCWSKAAEYARRAEDSEDQVLRAYFSRIRDSWVRLANREQVASNLRIPAVVGPSVAP